MVMYVNFVFGSVYYGTRTRHNTLAKRVINKMCLSLSQTLFSVCVYAFLLWINSPPGCNMEKYILHCPGSPPGMHDVRLNEEFLYPNILLCYKSAATSKTPFCRTIMAFLLVIPT